ncbi:SARP family transcriptional regulator [Kitasatospora sp. NE20-6]|uniref:AfsR/SARP family transcriptional regulator n=1 Tax=Kitasatospora sp. NE20-6 TaxID=2859066 RepID=UPI0034DBA3CD
MLLSFGVLGPLSLTVEGRQLSVGGSRQRTILALLLLSPDRTVPVDALVDAVWQGSPPATARTQVAICIAALRKAFKAEGCADEVITTAHPGYRLNTAGHRLDLLEYQRLTAEAAAAAREGRTAAAAEACRLALDLWRGPVLPGVAGRRVEDEAQRLEEQRLATYDEFAMLQLETGRHRELIPQLAALVREHPLRERSRQSLMLALYRSGRRAEAMEVFREARRLFVDELGLEPGPGLQELHDAVLRDDPGLAAPAEPPVPRPEARVPLQRVSPEAGPGGGADRSGEDGGQDEDGGDPALPSHRPREQRVPPPSDLPPNVPAFTGRRAELDLLDGMLAERTDDQPPAVGFVTGVAGVGKTGLAVHWAHCAARQFPDGRLFVDLCGHDPDHEPTAATEVLGRFLRSLGVSGDQIPPDQTGRVSMYRSLTSGRRILVVLDNVRTFAQIRPLLPASGGCAVVVTSRDPLEQLVLRHGAVRVQLGMLAPEEAAELLARMVTGDRLAADPEQSRRLAELCDRLPLALRIAAARLASKPHWTVRQLVTRLADARRRLDELSIGESQVRAGFALSYRHLPSDAARLYRLLGVLEVPDFTAWVGAALLGCDAYEAERLIETMVDAQLMEVVGSDPTGQLRYRFQNLLRLYARELAHQEEDPGDRAAALDRALAGWLTIAEVAHRKEYGGDFSLVHGSTPRTDIDPDLLGELTTAPLDWFEAERLSLIAVVEHAARLAQREGRGAGRGLDELAWDLTLCLGVLCETRNYAEEWRRCCDLALAAVRACGNLRGEAAVLAELGGLHVQQLRMEEARRCLDPALELFERIGEKHGWALALARLSAADRHLGDFVRAESRLREAREVFHQIGDVSSEVHALNNLAHLALEQGRSEEGVRLGEDAVRLARQLGESRGTAQAIHRLGRAYLAVGRLAEAEELLAAVARIVRAKQDLVGTCYALLGLAEARLRLGRPEQAREGLAEALGVLAEVDSPLVEGRVHFVNSEVQEALGRPEEARCSLLLARDAFDRAGSRPWREKAVAALHAVNP